MSVMQSQNSLDSWATNSPVPVKGQTRYITFGFGKIQEIKEVVQLQEGDWAVNGMQMYLETYKKVGKFVE